MSWLTVWSGVKDMVNPDDFKSKVRGLISQGYKIEFLGDDFDRIVCSLTKHKEEKLYNWISEVIKKNVQPITIGSKRPYKDWQMNKLLVFRYPMNMANIEYRILLVKVKNSFYIEFHLGDHKYYDKVRKILSLKKGSY